MSASQSHGSHDPSEGSYLVVARRYRPRLFDELVGQSHVVQALVNAIESDRVGHAYLFTGARGVGKTSTARIFAKCLNAPEGPTAAPDNSSDICRRIDSGDDIDVIEIDGASNRGIEEIRQLRAGVNIRPSRSRYKIYIIDEVHMLTSAAFNALLKTLEEPPGHVKFIFCTTDPEKIPITVLSRCQRFDFAPVEVAQLVARLEQIVADESRDAAPESLQLIARHAGGSVRDSQSLLEQLLAFTPGRLTTQDVHRMLGTAPDTRLAELVGCLARSDAASALEALDDAVTHGIDAGQLAEQLMGCLRDAMLVASGVDRPLLRFAGGDLEQPLGELTSAFGLPGILAALQVLDQTLTRIRHSSQARTLIEMSLVRICHVRRLRDLESLLGGASPASLSRRSEVGAASAAPRVQEAAVPVARTPSSAPSPEPRQPEPRQLEQPKPPHRQVGSRQVMPTQADTAPTAPTERAESAPNPVGTESDGTERANVGEGSPGDLSSDPLALWREACERVRNEVGPYGGFASAARWRGNGQLAVEFPQGYTLQKERCERPAAKAALEGALHELVGERIQVQFVMGQAAVQPEQVAQASPAERRRQRERAPLVRQAIDLFDAEISRIDEPPDSSS